MSNQFCNYHNHTIYSLLDGFSQLDEYCARAKVLDQPAVAITDHGNLYGVVDFYEAAVANNVKPFIGEEFYQARKTRFDRDGEELSSRGSSEWGQQGPYHCSILAYNNVGYHNLIKLSSRAFLEGFYQKPRIDHELLSEHNEGLVMLSGCLSGELQQALLRDDMDHATHTVSKMRDIFGPDRYFIEMMDHDIPEEKIVIPKLIEIAKTFDLKIVPTCDSHYTHKNESEMHDVMLCVNTKSFVADEERFRFSGDNFYLKSYDEMAQLFLPEYVNNTMSIYGMHDLDLNFDEYHFPKYNIPTGETAEEYLRKSTIEGMVRRFGIDWTGQTALVDRIEYELKVINDMGFPNYFLVTADIVNWAKHNDILVGFGRGSAAGSLVCYALRITEVNPLEWDLPFERFLVPGRKSMPDIDLDFDPRYRDQVIEYTRNKYGYDHTSQICNYNTIKAKKAVRDAARVLGYEWDLGDKICRAMPPAVFGVSKTIDECLETQEFSALYNAEADVKNAVDHARNLEGLVREIGVHAGGLVIADKPITDYVPVMQKGEGEPIVSQWDMRKIEKVGLLKIDFLGVRNLSIVDICIQNIKERTGRKLDFYKLYRDINPNVFTSLSRGENIGVFQLESEGLRELLIDMKPTEQLDLAALLALYRPGPMGSNVHHEFISRKNKRRAVSFLHPSLKPILSETFGLLLYQEQLLRIAVEVAGFTIGEADDLRKVIGKKLVSKMPAFRKKFVDGCVKISDMSREIANKLFGEIEHHASYSFSKNHSVPYSLLSYITSYLKVNYPVEYMAAALSTVQGDEDRLNLYLNTARLMGMEVLPPSITYSDADFKVKSDTEILYGLSGISGVDKKASRVVESRNEHVYTSIYDFMRRTDNEILNKAVIEAFIYAGCFDDLIADLPELELSRQDKIEVLKLEGQKLGVYLTEHPLADIHDLFTDKVSHTVSQINEGAVGSKVVVAGIVTFFKQKMTKTGRRMFTMKVEDMTGTIFVTVFPQHSVAIEDEKIKVGDILIITGKVEKKSDDENSTISLIYFEHERIDVSLLSGTKPIFLNFNHQPSYEQVLKISDIIDHNEGNSQVFLSFQEEDNKTVKMMFSKSTSLSVEKTLRTLIEVM